MHSLYNCIGLIDGTNIAIARPTDDGLHTIAYNENKGFQALKFQAVVSTHGYSCTLMAL